LVIKKETNYYFINTRDRIFFATTSCACQSIWLKKIIGELQFVQGEAIVIYCDNNSTIKLSQNPILHDRSKHIDVKYYYLRELTNRKVINLIYCKSEKQLTDIFTKLLKLSTFEKLTRLIGVYNV